MTEQTVVPPEGDPDSADAWTEVPDHELEELETDSSVPPRPEEEVADAAEVSEPPRGEEEIADEADAASP